MRVKIVKASVGLTINTGNFNSVRVDLAAEAEVDCTIEESAGKQEQLIEALKQRVISQVPSLKQMSKQAGG